MLIVLSPDSTGKNIHEIPTKAFKDDRQIAKLATFTKTTLMALHEVRYMVFSDKNVAKIAA